jgi:hypothetical protein
MAWVSKTISRVAAAAARQPDNNALGITKGERKAIQKFSDKLAKLPTPPLGQLTVTLNTSRVELRILQKLVKGEHTSLVTVIIPGYLDKMKEDPKRINEYLKASEERAAMLIDILNKIAEMVGPV